MSQLTVCVCVHVCRVYVCGRVCVCVCVYVRVSKNKPINEKRIATGDFKGFPSQSVAVAGILSYCKSKHFMEQLHLEERQRRQHLTKVGVIYSC